MLNEIVRTNLPNIPATINCGAPNNNSKGPASSMHFHDELEFLYVKTGKFQCVSNGKSYIGKPGDVIFLNSRVPHSTYKLEDNTNTCFLQFTPYHYSNEAISGISRYLARFINIGKEQVIIFKSNNERTAELTQYLIDLFDEYTQKKPSYELYIKADIYNIIAFLSRYNIFTDSSTAFNEKNIEKVLPALIYIDRHYSEPLTLDDLSSVLNFNPSYFCRLFKTATNSTFIEYLNFVRICKSERMLATSKKSIADISLEIGFASATYFNKVFRRFKGCTPTEYKKSKYALR